jgi:GNAT superfamily N-acetyltransferase
LPEERQFYWTKLYEHFIENVHFEDEQERDYFLGDGYRNAIEGLFELKTEPLKVYFLEENGEYRGYCCCKTYLHEDGKCFILEFCIDKPYRNKGLGRLFLKLVEEAEPDVEFFELNSEDASGFWGKLGFYESGVDEHGMKLYRKKHSKLPTPATS